MAALDQSIVGALRQIKSSISHIDRRTGITGKLDDDGTLNPNAESGLSDGYVWVRFDGESPRAATAVRCLMTGVAVGIPVVCAYNVDTREFEVTRIDPTRGVAALGVDLVRSLGSPDKSASYPTLVSSRDIVPGSLQAHSDGGLKVFIPSYTMANGRVWQNDDGGYTKTLTPTATSAKHSIALVGIDPAATTLNATAYTVTLSADRNLGEELIGSGGVLTTTGLTDVQAVIDADPNIDWRGYVQLENGDTTLDLNTMRPLFWRVPVMTGADGANAGRAGLVPAPAAGDEGKFLRGDATWEDASGGGTAVEPLALIDSEVVGSAVSSVSLTIPSGYKHLLVVYKAKSTRTDDTDTILKTQFNSDTGSNYGWLSDLRRVTTPLTTEDTNDPYIPINVVGSQTTPTNQANFWTTGQFRINNYADTDNYKILGNENDWYRSATSFGMHRVTGVWKNTAAITSITLTMNVGNIAAGSTFYVYGIGDATNDLYYQTAQVNGSALTQRGKFNFLSGTGITVSGADDSGNDESEITVALNINGLTTETTIDNAADYLPFYDASEGAPNKVTPNALMESPPAIGGTTPAAGTFAALRANSDLTLAGAPGKIKPASDSTTAIRVTNAAGDFFVTFDTTNKKFIIGDAPSYGTDYNFIIKGTAAANNAAVFLEHYNTGYARWVFANSNGNFTVTQDTVGTPFTIYAGTAGGMMVLQNNSVGIFDTPSSTQLQVKTTDPDKYILRLMTHASQVYDVQRVVDPSGNVLAAISAKGAGTFAPRDAVTNAITAALTLAHNTSGTPAAGYGASLIAKLESSTTEDTEVGRDVFVWNTATHASRVPDRVMYLTDSGGEREIMRMRATGSAGALGFFGTAPAAQQTGGSATAGGTYGATEQTMLQKVYDALRAFGLLT